MTLPTLDIFTGSESFGRIFEESNQINVKFWDVNIPFTNTEGRYSLNALGKTRILMVQGATDGTGFSGATYEDRLADFVATMESWVNNNGEQLQAQYTNSLGVSYNVDAVDWSWKRNWQQPVRILFTLIMKE